MWRALVIINCGCVIIWWFCHDVMCFCHYVGCFCLYLMCFLSFYDVLLSLSGVLLSLCAFFIRSLSIPWFHYLIFVKEFLYMSVRKLLLPEISLLMHETVELVPRVPIVSTFYLHSILYFFRKNAGLLSYKKWHLCYTDYITRISCNGHRNDVTFIYSI